MSRVRPSHTRNNPCRTRCERRFWTGGSSPDKLLRRCMALLGEHDGMRRAVRCGEKRENRPAGAARAEEYPSLVGDSVAVEVAADVKRNASAFPFACAIGCVRKTPTGRDRDGQGLDGRDQQSQEADDELHAIGCDEASWALAHRWNRARAVAGHPGRARACGRGAHCSVTPDLSVMSSTPAMINAMPASAAASKRCPQRSTEAKHTSAMPTPAQIA